MPLSKEPLHLGSFRAAREQGQTLVEFALCVVLFLTLLFGVVEFSRALWVWNTIVQATRAGARYAVAESSFKSNVENFVVYHNPSGTGTPVVPGLTTGNVDVRFFKNDGVTEPANHFDADVVQIKISGYTFAFMVPLFGSGVTLPPFKTTLPLEALGAAVP